MPDDGATGNAAAGYAGAAAGVLSVDGPLAHRRGRKSPGHCRGRGDLQACRSIRLRGRNTISAIKGQQADDPVERSSRNNHEV